MMAGHADRSAGVIRVTRRVIELVSGFLIFTRLSQITHVVQRKCAVGIEPVGLRKIIQCFVWLVVIQRGNTLSIKTGGMLLRR